MTISHEQLTTVAFNLLREEFGCDVRTRDVPPGRWGERPDAYGLRLKDNVSFIIECKVSAADFHGDKLKPFREQGKGVGNCRYFLFPIDLAPVIRHTIPSRWGTMEYKPNGVVNRIHPAEWVESDDSVEKLLLGKCLHRFEFGSPSERIGTDATEKIAAARKKFVQQAVEVVVDIGPVTASGAVVVVAREEVLPFESERKASKWLLDQVAANKIPELRLDRSSTPRRLMATAS